MSSGKTALKKPEDILEEGFGGKCKCIYYNSINFTETLVWRTPQGLFKGIASYLDKIIKIYYFGITGWELLEETIFKGCMVRNTIVETIVKLGSDIKKQKASAAEIKLVKVKKELDELKKLLFG